MERVNLTVQKRNEFKKGPARRYRQKGKIPGIVYGHNIENIPIVVDKKELKAIVRHHIGRNYMLNLNIEGVTHEGERWAIVRALQKDPVTEEFIHVDMYELKHNEPIHMTVPLHFSGGTPAGVKAGGHLEHNLREIEVKGLPKDIPEFIEINLESLEIGDAIHLKDMKQENIEFIGDENIVIAHVMTTRGPKAEAEGEGEEITEPEVIGKGKTEEEE